jgi:metal-responsive CopG/Arc/MetJ family transcriptional regulator
MNTKSIISANIDTELVKELKMKTKGTRSRIIERAIRAYLKGETDYSIVDVPERKLIAVLLERLNKESNYNDTPLILLLKERMA